LNDQAVESRFWLNSCMVRAETTQCPFGQFARDVQTWMAKLAAAARAQCGAA
jgi:hypothetical protein